MNKQKIKQDQQGLRWTGEILDCSMPLTFDTYNTCSFNCLYCFAFFQKSHSSKGYRGNNNPETRTVRSINPQHIKKVFIESLTGKPTLQASKQAQHYIKHRYTMQWGGLADGFDYNEDKYKISLDMLKFFDKIDYPLSISTKGVNFTKNKEYMELISKHPHNWHFKISIITNNKNKAKQMEKGVPTPQERIKAIKRLTNHGIPVTLRLRPYIIGLSEDYEELIQKASNAGADSVTTEYLCLEQRADKNLKEKYQQISNIVGYNILEFYKKHSSTKGYYRLNYKIKEKTITNMKQIAHKNKMRFYVSDAHHKEKSDAVCCCGCPPAFKVSNGQFAGALQKAKHNKTGTVQFKDIEPEINKIFKDIQFIKLMNYNTQNIKFRSKRYHYTVKDWFRENWNDINRASSPFRYFSKVLYPVATDKENNIIYKYNKKKASPPATSNITTSNK